MLMVWETTKLTLKSRNVLSLFFIYFGQIKNDYLIESNNLKFIYLICYKIEITCYL